MPEVTKCASCIHGRKKDSGIHYCESPKLKEIMEYDLSNYFLPAWVSRSLVVACGREARWHDAKPNWGKLIGIA